jgi:hypothetical protein
MMLQSGLFIGDLGKIVLSNSVFMMYPSALILSFHVM